MRWASPAALRRSAGGWAAEHGEPVLDGVTGEARPGPARLDQRARVGLDPQRQERTVLGGGQPVPDRCRDRREVVAADPVQQRELVARARASSARTSSSLLPNRKSSTRGLEPMATASGRSDTSASPCSRTYG